MNIRDYDGDPLTFDELSKDVKPFAIVSVLTAEREAVTRQRADKIARYKKMALHTRINTGAIRSLIQFDARNKALFQKMNDPRKIDSFILENLSIFTAEGVYLTF